MQWLEQKYIGMVSNRLRNFKRKGPALYNFSCPICGDSQSDQRKARGYIYEKKGKSVFHCHNCSATMGVPNLIKTIDQLLYNEYVIEKLKDEKSPQQIEVEQFEMKMKRPEFAKGILNGLKKVSQLKPDHPLKKYVDKRRIPSSYHHKLFVCPNFFAFVNNIIPDKFSQQSLENDETRLLIPFIDKEKQVHAFQGRALNQNPLKYITIVTNEDVPKVYGLDAVDFTETTYVTEGPIDSMFIPNSIATAGGDLVSALSNVQSTKSSMVIVYDNEPRSGDTKKKLEKAINQGYKVCIWPHNVDQKDINDMVVAGLSVDLIKDIIDNNTFSDLAAKLALKRWSKV